MNMKRWTALLIALVIALSTTCASAANSLSKGSKGKKVIELQNRLIALGLLSGEADGDFGEGTERAVKHFQRWLGDEGYEGVDVDGIVGSITWKYLTSKEIEQDMQVLEPGEHGEDVAALQGRLYDLNLLSDWPDGVYGSKTEAAISAFQRLMIEQGVLGAQVNGIADQLTRETLKSDLSGYGIAAPMFFDERDPLGLTPDYVYAQTCVLMDADSGEVLFEKLPDQQMYPASTTKIMTALLALEKLKLGKSITIPQEAADVPSDSSLVPVHPGEVMTVRDLLTGLMLRSGNDAANAVAVLTSGSISKFVSAMNRKAQALGLSGTHFTNPHGYHDPKHYTTARDLAVLTREALKKEAFVDIISTRSYTLPATNKRDALVIKNSYSILDGKSPYYDPAAFGVKTGTTSRAGYCFVCAAKSSGHTLIAVVMRAGREADCRWIDARRLFNYGFALYDLAEAA